MPRAGEVKHEVAKERITRARDLIFGIAAGQPLDGLTLDGSQGDDFALLEQMLNAFAVEFREAKRAAVGHERERQELIEKQRSTIQVLSAPVVDLWDGILAVPLVGPLDTERAEEMTARVLDRLHAGGERCLIIDVTGLSEIDTHTVDHLRRMISSLTLLGVYCVITGIRGPVAQTLVSLGVDLTAPTLRTLKEGLRECFKVLALAA